MTYKQDFYNTKEREVYDLFLEYLVPVMEDIENPSLVEEWIQNTDADAYEKNIHKDENLPSTKNKIDRNYKT